MTVPAAEIRPDEGTVHRLLSEHCPEYAHLPIRRIGEGWDNVTFRLGEALAVRLPRRAVAVPLLLNEQRWLPVLSPRLGLRVPMPVHVGRPDGSFPWPWSVVEWLDGETDHTSRLGDGEVARFARALRALHRAAPDEAPVSPVRGVALEARQEAVQARLQRLAGHPAVDAPRLEAWWREAASAPEATERRWLYGDLHPGNVVTRGAALVGLIDWGDVNAGDVATDLACAWTLFEAGPRRTFLETYGPSDDLLRRARGWALHLGLALVESGEARHAPMGVATLRRLSDSPTAAACSEGAS